MARALLDHEVVHGTKLRAVSVVYCSSFDFIRSDQIARLVRGGAGHGPLLYPVFAMCCRSSDGMPRLRLAELATSVLGPLSGRVAPRRTANAGASVLVAESQNVGAY